MNDSEINKQENLDNIAVALSLLFGASVVPKEEYDKVNKEKQALLRKTKDIEKISRKLIFTECKLQAFVRYHRQWKPTTRNFEKRLLKLKEENLYLPFTDFPTDIAENLKEAYKCYINGLSMACYIMILRTIEITINLIYKEYNLLETDDKGKPIFVPTIKKLNWVKSNKMIGGADYNLAKAFIEARNDSIHEVYIPTEKQLLSAFETVIILISKLNLDKKLDK